MKKMLAFGKKTKSEPSSSALDTSNERSEDNKLKDKNDSKLHQADSSDVSGIRQNLDKFIYRVDKENRTLLHLACSNGNFDVVKLLIDHKAEINVYDKDHQSPLMKAIQAQHKECAAILLEHGADPNVVDVTGNAALHLAALGPSVPMAVQLLKHGANINAANKDGCTPLILAVTKSNQELVEILVKDGADVNSRDKNGRTSLMIAAASGHLSLVKLLLHNNADGRIKDANGFTADEHAFMNYHYRCSEMLFDHVSRTKQASESKIEETSMLSPINRAARAFLSDKRNNGYDGTDDISTTESDSSASVEVDSAASGQSCPKQVPDHSFEKEKEVIQENSTLEQEISALRLELQNMRSHYEDEKNKFRDENEMLKHQIEDLKTQLNISEETLAQTVVQHNGQLSAVKTEATMLCSQLEQENQNRESLETELRKMRSHLNSTLQALEASQQLTSETECTLQREREEWFSCKDKLTIQLSRLHETNTILSQQLNSVEAKSSTHEEELQKTTLLLEQAQCKIKDLVDALQDTKNDNAGMQEIMQEKLDLTNDKNMQLLQQLEDLKHKVTTKEKAFSDIKKQFSETVRQLQAAQSQVHKAEKANKDLSTKSNLLQEQINKLEAKQAEHQSTIRQLQQELASSLEKLSVSEATLAIIKSPQNDTEEEKQNLQKELEACRTKLNSVEVKSSTHEAELQKTTLLLEHAQCKIKDLVDALQDAKNYNDFSAAMQEIMQEKLALTNDKNMQLLQQLEDLKHKVTTKEKAFSNLKKRFSETVRQLQAAQSQVHKAEETNKDLSTKSNLLQEQVNKLEAKQAEHQSTIRQLQQELASSLEKLSASEATLAVIKSHQSDHEEEKQNLQKELEACRTKKNFTMSQSEQKQASDTILAELNKFKMLYAEELKMTRSLISVLKRSNEKPTETDTRRLREQQWNTPLSTTTFLNGRIPANPVIGKHHPAHFGSSLACSRGSGLSGDFQSSAKAEDIYFTKVKLELDKKITEELKPVKAELMAEITRASPVDLVASSLKYLTTGEDAVSRAQREYRDVLRRHYMF